MTVEGVRRLQDTFFEQIETMGPEIGLTEPEKSQVRSVLGNDAFRKACALVFTEATMIGPQLIGLDLSTADGVASAMKLQGKAMGMVRVFEGLFALLEATEEGDSENAT